MLQKSEEKSFNDHTAMIYIRKGKVHDIIMLGAGGGEGGCSIVLRC